MKIDEQVLMRFFSGKCTAEERKQVAAYLQSHKEILDELFNEEEWLQTLNSEHHLTTPYQEDVLLGAIRAKLYERKKTGIIKHIRPWLKWSAVACFAVLAGCLVFNYIAQPVKDARPASPTGAGVAAINDSVIWKNQSNTIESRYLSDGSLVYLQPGSVLRYRDQFEPGKRLLNLKGEARFKVAKNKQRPFTVVAGNVSTTALGTIFTVNNFNAHKRITVKLQEGKVLVKNMDHPADTLHLLPGEFCAFDGKALYRTDSLYYAIKPTGINRPKAPEKNYYIDNTCQLDASHVVFKNTSLPSVFKALNRLYSIKIDYTNVPDSVLSKTLYTGSFKKAKMKAADVLKVVALINDMQCEQVDAKTYLISIN